MVGGDNRRSRYCIPWRDSHAQKAETQAARNGGQSDHHTNDGRAFQILDILDEYTRECLLIRVRRELASWDVLEALSELSLRRGVPGFIRSDDGPEFGAGRGRRWIATVGAKTAYIESFHARFRDELLDQEIFTSLRAAQILIEAWRRHYHTPRPHSALGYRPPAPETIEAPSRASGSATLRRMPGLAAVPARHEHCGWTNRSGRIT